MNFEDLETLKHNFTVYNFPTTEIPASNLKTFLVVRKRDVTYTRIRIPPQVYGVQYHFKMMVVALISKLRLTHA
jgi:hypothetical protein